MGGSFALGVVGSTDAGPTEESHCPWVSSASIAQSTTADNEWLAFDATPLPAYLGDQGLATARTSAASGWLTAPEEFARQMN